MDKRNLMRYFSGNALKHMPLGKVLAALFCVMLIVLGTGVGIALTVVNAANTSGVDSSVSQVVVTPTPQPTATATPEPTAEPVQLAIEATAVQQSIGITLMNVAQDMPMLGTAFDITLAYEPAKGSDQKVETETHQIDPKTGTLLIENAAIGSYTITVDQVEGYVMPEPTVLEVTEKVEYKADVDAVKDQIKQSDEVNEAEEDNGKNSHVGAGSGSGADPMATPVPPTQAPTEEPTATPVPTQAPTQVPSGNDYSYNESSVEEKRTTVYIAQTKTEGDRKYLLYTDGTVSPYYITKTAKAQDGTEFLVQATLDESKVNTPTQQPTQEPTEQPVASQSVQSASESADSASRSISGPAAFLMQLDAGRFARSFLGAGAAAQSRALEAVLTFYDEAAMQGIAHEGFIVTGQEKVITTLYSGWYPSVEDKQAYYDPDTHKKVTGTKVIAGVSYQFDANGQLVKATATPAPTATPTPEPTAAPVPAPTQAPSIWTKGVDVSKYQGVIDWNQVKASGIEFAIIRVGYRGYGSGVLVEDSMFKRNIQGAQAAGLKIGLYFYSQAINEAEAVEEASMVVSLCRGYNIQYPIYFDTEKVSGDTGRADTISRTQRTANAVAFCETIRNAGYTPGVYSYADWFYNKLNMANLTKYSIWIAQYRDQLSFDYNYDIWQYSSTGKVPGIPMDTDMNVSKLG